MQDIEGFLNSFVEFKGKIRDNLASEFSKVLLSAIDDPIGLVSKRARFADKFIMCLAAMEFSRIVLDSNSEDEVYDRFYAFINKIDADRWNSSKDSVESCKEFYLYVLEQLKEMRELEKIQESV